MMAYYVTCRIGMEWYGIPIQNVMEVLHLVALNEAPGSERVGVMTLRERVIPVLDMRQYFGIKNYDYSLDTPIIALRHDEQALGIIVDETDNVVEVKLDSSQPYSEPGIETVLRVDDRMLFILDTTYFFNLQTHLEPD